MSQASAAKKHEATMWAVFTQRGGIRVVEDTRQEAIQTVMRQLVFPVCAPTWENASNMLGLRVGKVKVTEV